MTTKKRILNKSKKTVVAGSYRLCRSIRSKARGLMFTSQSSVHENSLLFEFGEAAHQSLHMFFVFYPIDVLFLDEKKKVVDVKERFSPFTVYNSRVLSKFVVELPCGAVKKSRTKEGDVLKW